MPKPQPPAIAPELVAQLRAAVPEPPAPFSEYLFRPEDFLQDILNVRLFPGFSLDWVRDVAIAWLHGYARERYNRLDEDPVETCRRLRPDLPVWQPGDVVRNTLVLQGGSGLGKSVVAAGVMLWGLRVSKNFLGVVYAPLIDQAYRTTWRYLDAYLNGDWPGAQYRHFSDILEARKGQEKQPAIELSATRAVSTKAVNQGGTKVQGSHAIIDTRAKTDSVSASIHIFEEADGIDDPTVFDAVKTMTDKGVALWILCLNPATAAAPVQSLRGGKTRRYEISVLDTPNVREGRDVIPGASNREWVDDKIGSDPSDWASPVPEHDPRKGTFELSWRPGIFEPRPPWWWRVLGKVPPSGSGDTAVPEAVYLSACSRDWRRIFRESDPTYGSLGVDVAQSDAGQGDSGSIARLWRGTLQIIERPQQKDTRVYGRLLIHRLKEMLDEGCQVADVRIDNGGGFGRDVYNQIADSPILEGFRECNITLHDFGGVAQDGRRFRNFITEAYFCVSDVLQNAALVEPPPELRTDLCGRRVKWESISTGNGGKADVVALEQKRLYRDRTGRSPDDGDAAALACYRRRFVHAEWSAFSESRWSARVQQDEDSWIRSQESDEDYPDEGMRWGR